MNLVRLYRYVECCVLFIALPVVVYYNWLPIPKIAALLIITLICVLILAIDDSYVLQRLSYRPRQSKIWKRIINNTALVAVGIFVLVIFLQPDRLFQLPSNRPVVWGIILALYPLLSALPQELIYREFFFHRYKKLFGTGWMMVAASASLFAFLHIIYDNYWAIIISLIGGFMFARTYRQSRSLYVVSIEHAIYGCLIFTIGLGNYFYEGF